MISKSAKRKAADQGIYKPLKIIRKEMVNAPAELTQFLNSNDINQIRKTTYHEHRKTQIQNILMTHINKLEIKANIDKDFLLDNNSVYNIIIFSTKKNLKYIYER
jgi:hypothetical protein